MSNTKAPRTVKTYNGTVLLTYNENHVNARKASGDTDASEDFVGTFTMEGLTVHGKTELECMENFASELRSMADAVMFNAKRLGMKRR